MALAPLEYLLKNIWKDAHGTGMEFHRINLMESFSRWKKAIENVHEELLYSPYVMGIIV